ncbi:AAA domain-containing protein [Pseudomonas sp. S1(2024)]|uniref:AAA domain-containing protein n=1 Tax=Pseudomonas sp. S1(2024) TaxID=3390191 RepID=UPI00397A503A
MDIIVRGNGLHKSETNALDQMQKHLRNSWFGYASVLVADKQGSMEFDLIVVTHDRVLVVELKEWHGKLTNFDGNWVITTPRGQQNRGKSAYHRKRDQGYRLAAILKREIGHKLSYDPYVEAHVVLCGSATPEFLPEGERKYVHTLEDFLKIAGNDYDNFVQQVRMIKFDEMGRLRPNKAQHIFDSFFRGNRVELAEFNYLEYTAANAPDRVHDQHLFSEYPATKAGPPVSKAMMRRWDLATLGLAFHDDDTWRRVVTREDYVYRTASAANSPLEEFLLRPLSPMVEDNITSDCVELFELRKNTLRLEQHLNLHGHKWSVEERLDLTKALLLPFSEMHGMGFAHRDIDAQNLWYSQDSRIILTSGFHAAFIPDKGTVKDLAERLRSNSTLLPEDVYASEGEVLSPFAKDVYLLALVAHKICFHGVKFNLDDGIPVWRPIPSDPFEGKLDAFFAKAMDLEQKNRFANASEMLAEFNSIAVGKSLQYDDTQEVMQAITKGDFIKADWNPYMLMSYFPPVPGVMPAPVGEKMVYRCLCNGEEALLKFWPKAVVDLKNPGINRRILRMRQRIEQTLEDELPLPGLLDHGLFAHGNGLFVVTRFEDGTAWPDYVAQLETLEQKLEAAAALCCLLNNVHGLDFAHGDLHPGNILVRPTQADEPLSLMFIDALDFGDTSEPYNVEYGPLDPSTSDSFGRDCYAVYQIVRELLGNEAPAALTAEFELAKEQPNGIPVAIDPLAVSITAALEVLRKPAAAPIEPLKFIADAYKWPAEQTLLQAGESAYYLHVAKADRNPEHLYIRITAQDKRLSFNFDPVSEALSSAWLADVSFGEYISAGQKAQATFVQPIAIQKGISTKANEEAFVRFLLEQEPVQTLLKKAEEGEDEEGCAFSETCDDSVDQTIRPTAIWRAMLETEGDQLMRVEIDNASLEESASGSLLIPYVSQDNRELDFNAEAGDIGIYLEGEGRPFGEVIAEECSSTRLAVRMFAAGIRSVKQKLTPGTELIFESKLSNASRERRKKAMERVLNGVSRIPHLPAYFDQNGTLQSKVIGKIPDEAAIRARYDSEFEQLNPRQIVAFQRTISEGPIQVLQGPPGTGKTAFVTKLIHYLFENDLAGNILLVGQSHASVDTVAVKARELCAKLGTEVSVIRLGHESAIDDQMLQCHSSSIQRQIRFKFQREYEKRINALSSRLMLSQDLVEELAKLHRSISPILDRVRTYTKQKGDAAAKRHIDESVRIEQVREFDERIASCVESLQHHMDSRGYEFDLPSPAASEFWDELSRQVARQHGVTDLLALQRLNNLISISQDWIDVLGSGGANYDRFLVKTSQLVCGTLVGIGAGAIHIEEMEFDWVIIDEAGRAQASELMIAMQCGRRVLLVGDHKQLAPMYEKRHVREVARKLQIDEREAVKTDFERAFVVNNGITLNTQYRMIEPIGNIVSHCFYNNELHSFRKKAGAWCSELPYPLNKPVSWIDSGSGERAVNEDEPEKGKFVNKHEVAVCLHLLRQLARPEHMEKLNAKCTPMSPQPIGVITMYRGQKRLIEEELSRAEWAAPLRGAVRIDTVDSYQGSENLILFLSLVRNNDKGFQGFLGDVSRINVALSRAKDRLVVIGSKRMWSGVHAPSALGSVVSYIAEHQVTAPDDYEIVDGTTVIEGQRHE